MDMRLTQAQLGGIMGVTESTVWNWEHSRGVSDQHKKHIEDFIIAVHDRRIEA
jgi:transcriptional regulator with XRE-family HTH domain